VTMRRRDILTLAGATAIAHPFVARAQQFALPVVGFLHSGSPGPFASLVAAFRDGLREAGYVVGRNVLIDFRWAEGNYDLVPSLALDLVRRQATVIVAAGGSVALAAKATTRTIPIVFISGGDPLGSGLVAGLDRPGGNATGVNIVTAALNQKRLSLLREIVPNTTLVAVLLNTNNPNSSNQLTDLQQAARSLGQAIHIAKATSERDIDTAFASFPDIRPDALFVGADAFFYGRRNQIVRLAGRYGLPALYSQRDFAMAGGLISYGASLAFGYRQAGLYAGRILDGSSPATLPVIQSTQLELVINQRTARSLGLTVPPNLLAQADEVIE
jgi:putative tryptophan/tyrosine transport system substrate-binding protein